MRRLLRTRRGRSQLGLLMVIAVMSSLAFTDLGPLTGQELHDHRAHAGKGTTAPAEAAAFVPPNRLGSHPCVDGKAAGLFACEGIDLVGFVPYGEIATNDRRAALGRKLSEAWGWVDPENGDEYALIGNTSGAEIFRLDDPSDPTYLGRIQNHSAAHLTWYDIKVNDNTAYLTSESAPMGMQVFDLTRLRGVATAREWLPDTVYAPNLTAHNVVVNEDSDMAYLVGSMGLVPVVAGVSGTVGGTEPCNGGLHAVDISNPLAPVPAGCFIMDGYTHDAQCVTYEGPDPDHQGSEICVAYNEDDVVVIDMTDPLAAEELGRFTYEDVRYTHQGWFTEDQRYVVFNDEGDETGTGTPTRTLVGDLTDLDDPKLVGWFNEGRPSSIDHNNYIKSGLAYQSNYTSGLRVLDLDGIATAELEEVAYFDTFPLHDGAEFLGTWGNYPFYPSGHIVVSSGTEGVFVLKVHEDVLAAHEDAPAED